VSGALIQIAGAVRMVTPERCPHCGASLVGPEVTEENNPALYPQYSHISRAGILYKATSFTKMEPQTFICPDCGGRFLP
jgi:predicted RNA-binding Zn-ribbon protein involved in translation (DUF1610 family)